MAKSCLINIDLNVPPHDTIENIRLCCNVVFGDKKAKEAFYYKYQKLIKSEVAKFCRSIGYSDMITLSDYEQTAWAYIFETLWKYDAHRASVSTFIVNQTNAVIRRYKEQHGRTVYCPSVTQQKFNKIRNWEKQYEAQHDCPPTEAEIKEKFKLSPKNYLLYIEYSAGCNGNACFDDIPEIVNEASEREMNNISANLDIAEMMKSIAADEKATDNAIQFIDLFYIQGVDGNSKKKAKAMNMDVDSLKKVEKLAKELLAKHINAIMS